MIISRLAITLALLSLLIAVYGGSPLVSALIRCGVVFVVAFAVLFIVKITLMYVYRKTKESEYGEIEGQETVDQTGHEGT